MIAAMMRGGAGTLACALAGVEAAGWGDADAGVVGGTVRGDLI